MIYRVPTARSVRDREGMPPLLFVAAMISFLFLPECSLCTETYFKRIFIYIQYKLPLENEKKKKTNRSEIYAVVYVFAKEIKSGLDI